MKKLLRSVVAVVAVSIPVLAFGGSALAGGKHGKGKDKSAQVQNADGKFSRFLLSPHGEIRGLLLDNGGIVHVHPSAVRDTSLKAGDAVKIEGFGKPGHWFGAKVTKNGAVVVEKVAGKPGKPGKGEKKKGDKKSKGALSAITSTGTVTTLLEGRKGKIHGVVMSDGTVAYAGHKGDLGALGIKKGDALTLTGKGGSYALGRAMKIEEVMLPSGAVKKL